MDDPTDRREDDVSAKSTAEGVRIIGAEEAAEAVERGEVAPRLSESEPRYGDRPTSPPEGTRPALRFPLAADSDPSNVTRQPILPPVLPGDDPSPSGSVELPPWTDPPTGEVPAVLAGGGPGEDLDAWSSFATSSPTHWHGGNESWSEDDAYSASALGDDDTRLGALDDRERPRDEDLFSFDDVDDLVEKRAADRAATQAHDTIGIHDQRLMSDLDLTDPDILSAIEDVPIFSSTRSPESDPADVEAQAERPGRRRSRHVARSPRDSHDGGSGRGSGSVSAGGRDVPTAVIAGVGIAIVALVLFGLGSGFAALLVVVIVTLCGVEFFGAVQRGGARPAALLGLLATATFPLATYWRGDAAIPLLLVLTVVFSLLWYLAGAGGDTPVLEGVGITLMGVAWIGLLGSFATLFLRGTDGRGILLAIILVTVAYDIGGFFFGRAFGHRPLSAASPNKTVEGLLGGSFASILMGLLLGGLSLGLPFHGWGHGFLLGVTAAIFAPLGDLCESVVKRDLHIKDMGTLIPGHGGMLDRVDGLLFVLPAAYYLVVAFHWL